MTTAIGDVELWFHILMWPLAAFALNLAPLLQVFANNEVLSNLFGIPYKPDEDITLLGVVIVPGGVFYTLLHLAWTLLMTFAYWLVRRNEAYTDVLASNILFYVLMAVIAFWPWFTFPFELITFGAVALVITILINAGVTIVFWIQGPWYAGLLALFATLILVLIFAQYLTLRQLWQNKFVKSVRTQINRLVPGKAKTCARNNSVAAFGSRTSSNGGYP